MSCQCERSGHRSLATTLLLLATLWPACRGNENRAAAARDGGGDGGGDTAISNRDLAASDGYESGDLTFEVELDGRGDLPGNSVERRALSDQFAERSSPRHLVPEVFIL